MLRKEMKESFAKAGCELDAGFDWVDGKSTKLEKKVDKDIRELRGDMRGFRGEFLAGATLILGVLIKSHGL